MLEKTFGRKKAAKKQTKATLSVTTTCNNLADDAIKTKDNSSGEANEERYLHLNTLINKINTKHINSIKEPKEKGALYIDKIDQSQYKMTYKGNKKDSFHPLKNIK